MSLIKLSNHLIVWIVVLLLINMSQQEEARNFSSILFKLTYSTRFLYQLGDLFKESATSSDLVKKVNPTCLDTLRFLVQTPTSKEWSLSMLDAGAPLPVTLKSNMMTSVGGFSQCLAIKDTSDMLHPIDGQYCMLQLQLYRTNKTSKSVDNAMTKLLLGIAHISKRYPLTVGVCVPLSCTSQELSHIFSEYFESIPSSFVIKSSVQHCQNNYDSLGNPKTLLSIAMEKNLMIVLPILMTAILFVLAGTVLELFSSPKKLSASRPILITALLCFSLIRNFKVLFGKKTFDSSQHINIEQRFTYLHGMRVVFLLWIILAHCCSLMPASPIMPFAFASRYPFDVFRMLEMNPMFTNILNNGTLAVEGFFLMSGLLFTSLMIAKKMYKNAHFISYVLFRWTRLAIPLLGLIVINKSIILFGSGPFFSTTTLESTIQKGCHDRSWWKELFLVHNWSQLSTTCVPWSWFICAEFQINLVAFILVLLIKQNRMQLSLVYSMIMISISIFLPLSFLFSEIATFSNIDLINQVDNKVSVNSYIIFYSGTHNHLGSYFYGAILGQYIAFKQKIVTKRFTKATVWWLSISVVAIVPFLNVPDQNKFGHLIKGIAIGMFHGIWVIALGIIFYFLSNVENSFSYGYSLKKFLSSSYFHPLGRLSFSMYMTHMTMIWYNIYTAMAPIELNNINMSIFSFGILIETMFSGFVLFVLFECPAINLIKIFVSFPQDKTIAIEQVYIKNKIQQSVVQLEQDIDLAKLRKLTDVERANHDSNIDHKERFNNNQAITSIMTTKF